MDLVCPYPALFFLSSSWHGHFLLPESFYLWSCDLFSPLKKNDTLLSLHCRFLFFCLNIKCCLSLALWLLSSQMHGFSVYCYITNDMTWENFFLRFRLNSTLKYAVIFSVSQRELSSFSQICSSILMNGSSLVSLSTHFPRSLPSSLSHPTVTDQSLISH